MMTYKEAMEKALLWIETSESYSTDPKVTTAEVRVAEGYIALAREIREAGKGLSKQEVDELWN